MACLPDAGDEQNQSIGMAWLQLVVVNAIAGVLIYAAPITEHFETKVLDAKVGHFWHWLLF